MMAKGKRCIVAVILPPMCFLYYYIVKGMGNGAIHQDLEKTTELLYGLSTL